MNINKIKWSLLVTFVLSILAIIVPILIPEIRVFFDLDILSKHGQFDLSRPIDRSELPIPKTPKISGSHKSKLQLNTISDSGVNNPKNSIQNELEPLELGGLETIIRRNKPEDYEKSFGHLEKEKKLILPINSN